MLKNIIKCKDQETFFYYACNSKTHRLSVIIYYIPKYGHHIPKCGHHIFTYGHNLPKYKLNLAKSR